MMQSWTLLLGAPCPSAICGPIFLGSPPARPLLPILQPERLPHHRLRIHSVCWQWKHTPCASDTGSRKVIFFAQRFHASLSKICILQCVTKLKIWTKPNPKLFFLEDYCLEISDLYCLEQGYIVWYTVPWVSGNPLVVGDVEPNTVLLCVSIHSSKFFSDMRKWTGRVRIVRATQIIRSPPVSSRASATSWDASCLGINNLSVLYDMY